MDISSANVKEGHEAGSGNRSKAFVIVAFVLVAYLTSIQTSTSNAIKHTQKSKSRLFYKINKQNKNGHEILIKESSNSIILTKVQKNPLLLNSKPETQEKSDKTQEEHTLPFICPTFEELTKIPDPNNCHPKYRSLYKSSFIAVHAPFNPGPSEQTHGIKDIIMATAFMRKSLTLSPFTRHGRDELSKERGVPFGARVDLKSLCNFITIQCRGSCH